MESRYLFRGKRVDGGWVEGTYHYSADGKYHYILRREKLLHRENEVVLKDREVSEVIPETVGQATGLLDKNGMMIFEGDQVKVFIQGAWFETTVFWGIKSHGWSLKCDRTNEKFGTIKYYSLPSSKHIEVIGNIHDKN